MKYNLAKPEKPGEKRMCKAGHDNTVEVLSAPDLNLHGWAVLATEFYSPPPSCRCGSESSGKPDQAAFCSGPHKLQTIQQHIIQVIGECVARQK